MSEQVQEENKKKEFLTIQANREDREYAFNFPEGVLYSEMADVLLQMRDHVIFVGRLEAQQKQSE